MRSQEFAGKTTQEAIDAGLAAFGVTIADVHVDVLQEGAKGLFGLFGSKPAKVRLTLVSDEEEKTDDFSINLREAMDSVPETRTAPEKRPQPARQPRPAQPRKPAEAPKPVEKPVEKAEEKPAEEKPAEEKPAEEKPAEPDWKDRYARALADFDNFRRRTERDREDLAKFAAREVIKDLLTTADNLALALDKAKDKADDPFVAGVKMVYDGLLKTLADHGATPLDAVGEPFDANFHEALAQLPSADVEEGVVMNEVKRGWLMHGRLLRAAQVVVSAGKGA